MELKTKNIQCVSKLNDYIEYSLTRKGQELLKFILQDINVRK